MAHGALPRTSLRDPFTTKRPVRKRKERKENTSLNSPFNFGQRNLCKSFNLLITTYFNKLAIKNN